MQLTISHGRETSQGRLENFSLSLSTVSSFCLISSEFALTVFRWEKEEEEGVWLIGSTSGKSSRGRYYANR